jgi:hypothetical protein
LWHILFFSFHAANLGIIFQICKYLAEKHRRAGECQGAKKNEEKDTKKRKPRGRDFRFLVLSLKSTQKDCLHRHTLLAEERPRDHDIFSILFGTFKYTLYLCTQIQVNMTEVHKKYRLTSMEEPTDEMLQALMEDVAMAARESTARAKAEKQRRFSEVVRIIKARRSQRKKILND